MSQLARSLVLQRFDYWLNVAIFQGGRLTKLLAAQSLEAGSAAHAEASAQPGFKLGRDHLLESADGFFFFIAARNALRWVEKVRAVSPHLGVALDDFSRLTEEVTDLGDMHEHEERYLAGKADHHERYLVQPGEWEGASAHSFIAQGDDVLIGGRLNVRTTLDALRKVQAEVERTRRGPK